VYIFQLVVRRPCVTTCQQARLSFSAFSCKMPTIASLCLSGCDNWRAAEWIFTKFDTAEKLLKFVGVL
jgi:hypothetical protein